MELEHRCLQLPAHPGHSRIALGLGCSKGKQGSKAPVLMAAPSSLSVITPCCPPLLQPFPGHSRLSQPTQPPPPAFPLQGEHLKNPSLYEAI